MEATRAPFLAADVVKKRVESNQPRLVRNPRITPVGRVFERRLTHHGVKAARCCEGDLQYRSPIRDHACRVGQLHT